MRPLTIRLGGTRTRNSMPLQAPGMEGSVGLQHTPPASDETASASRQDRQAILGGTDSQAGDPPRDRLKGKRRTSSRTPALLFTPPPPDTTRLRIGCYRVYPHEQAMVYLGHVTSLSQTFLTSSLNQVITLLTVVLFLTILRYFDSSDTKQPSAFSGPTWVLPNRGRACLLVI